MGMKHFKNKDIQHHLGVSHSAVSQWFSGQTRPNLENILKMRDQFGIPVDAWLDIKSYVLHNQSMPDTTVHDQVESEEKSHLKETA